MATVQGKRSLVLPAAVIALGGLLAVLATLQWRWVGQISESERARMRAGANARAEQLGREFDREITRAFAGVQIDADSVRSRDWSRYAEHYARWASRSPYPGLIHDVFLVDREKAAVARFDPSTGSFLAVEWPSFLVPLRERMESSRPGAEPSGPEPESEILLHGVPVLMSPVAPGQPPARGFSREAMRAPNLLVVVLDDDVIRDEILPALVRRHFGGEKGELEYAVEVTSRSAPETVIYQSEETARVPREDATANLFMLRFDELSDKERSDLAALRRPGERRERFGARRGFRSFVPGPEAGHWRLVASRRGGSVDAVVDAARRRNLAVSFGVLLLLGGSAGLVLAAAGRERRLAARQIEFVASVSHELRTPVAVICSAGENLADGVVADAPQVRRYGATIRDEGRRLAEMVEQVLDFAGTYSGRRTFRVERLDPAHIVEEVLAREGPRAAAQGFTVERRVGVGIPAIDGDAGALRRALGNLLDNARKYSGPSRWIAVAVEAATLGGRPAVRFAVEDHGLGIDAEARARIFEPFYRSPEAQAGREHGFGLGLSLVERIVQAHGGVVGVESVPGEGSVFSIVVPAANAEKATRATEGEIHGIADSAG